MKTRAILLIVSVILISGLTSKPASGQDTIYTGAFPSPESFKELTEQLKIMEFALQEQLKDLEFNSDSLEVHLKKLQEQLENMPDPIIPEEYLKNFQEEFSLNFPDDFMKDFNMDMLEDFQFKFQQEMQLQEDIMKDFQKNLSNRMFSTNVKLEGESSKKEVVITVEEEIPALVLNINGGVRSGSVRVDILDPSGKKQGSFSIENTDNNSNETVNSSINKNLNSPQKGNWKVLIVSDKAYGSIHVMSFQEPVVMKIR